LDIGVQLDIVKKSGAWFSYNDQRLGQGRENVKKFFKDNPELCKEIENKIRAQYDKAFIQSVEAHVVDDEAE
jgi:recombination protein RecA